MDGDVVIYSEYPVICLSLESIFPCMSSRSKHIPSKFKSTAKSYQQGVDVHHDSFGEGHTREAV